MQGVLTILRYIPHTQYNGHVVKTSMSIHQYESTLLQLTRLYPQIEIRQAYSILPGNEYKNNSKRSSAHDESI